MDVYVDSGPFKLVWLFSSCGIAFLLSIVFATSLLNQINMTAPNYVALTSFIYALLTTMFGFLWTYTGVEEGSLF